jgi:hypothetical protein
MTVRRPSPAPPDFSGFIRSAVFRRSLQLSFAALPVFYEIRDGTVIAALAGFCEEAARQLAAGPVIGRAFAAFPFPRTGFISAGAGFEILFLTALHKYPGSGRR